MSTIRIRSKSLALAATACMICSTTILAGHKPGHDPGGGNGGGGSGGGGGSTFAYEMTDLLGLPGYAYQSEAWFITDRDPAGNTIIFGDSLEYVEGVAKHGWYPVLWHVNDAGSFPVTDPTNLGLPSFARQVAPMGINRQGVTIGVTRQPTQLDDNGNSILPGFVQLPGQLYQELPSPVSRNTGASGINEQGAIVGNYQVVTDDPLDNDGLAWVGGMWQLQSDGSIDGPISLGGFTPTDINNHGVMAGSHDGYPAIAWLEGSELQIEPLDTSLRYKDAAARAINDFPVGDERLTVVGDSSINEAGLCCELDSDLAFAWKPFDTVAPATLLGTLGGHRSQAYDVNDQGQIVGRATTNQNYWEAFVYLDGVMTSLNDLVDVGGRIDLEIALGINNDGDIVGAMDLQRPISEWHGFLIRPVAQSPALAGNAVPEPASWALAAMGLLVLLSIHVGGARYDGCDRSWTSTPSGGISTSN